MEILCSLGYYFKLGDKGTEAGKISNRTAENWLKYFKERDLSLKIKPKILKPSVFGLKDGSNRQHTKTFRRDIRLKETIKHNNLYRDYFML